MLLGYIRVSTVRQADEGTSLEGQRQSLLDAGVAETAIYTDAGASGASLARPGLTALRIRRYRRGRRPGPPGQVGSRHHIPPPGLGRAGGVTHRPAGRGRYLDRCRHDGRANARRRGRARTQADPRAHRSRTPGGRRVRTRLSPSPWMDRQTGAPRRPLPTRGVGGQ